MAQSPVEIADGETEEALELRLAALAGDLMAEALAGLASGALTPTAQDETRATMHPWPTADDYTISAAHWSARRAYTFARGVGGREQPITLVAADGARFRLREPLSYDSAATLAAPWRRDGDHLTLACAPGVLRCRIALDDG